MKRNSLQRELAKGLAWAAGAWAFLAFLLAVWEESEKWALTGFTCLVTGLVLAAIAVSS